MADLLDKVREDFWQFVAMDRPAACWEWHGNFEHHRNGSYGRYTRRGLNMLAHRLAWLLDGRQEPDKEHRLVNRCGSTTCINPDHWELMTTREATSRAGTQARDNRAYMESVPTVDLLSDEELEKLMGR